MHSFVGALGLACLLCSAASRAQARPAEVPSAVAAERLAKQIELDEAGRSAMLSLWQLGADAVPPLIRTLKHPRLEVVRRACAVLHELGPTAAPARAHIERLLPKADAATAAALRWALHGVTAEHFVIACYSADKVVFLDGAGEVVREHGGLASPWDVQVLPDGHLLVVELRSNKVRELDREGQECWTAPAEVGRPLRAQRLYDGNTLIVDPGKRQLLEVDPAGKVVWSHRDVTANWGRRLLDGHTLFVDGQANALTEVDRDGKVVASFGIPADVYGAQRLPDGHTLLAVRGERNELVEMDGSGGEVGKPLAAMQPNAVLRLPDGAVLLCSMAGVSRCGPDGRELWQYATQWAAAVSR